MPKDFVKLTIPEAGECEIHLYSVLVDAVNLIGIINVSVVKCEGVTKFLQYCLVFQVSAKELLYYRTCSSFKLAENTYAQLLQGEYSNNNIYFVDGDPMYELFKATESVWKGHLGCTFSLSF